MRLEGTELALHRPPWRAGRRIATGRSDERRSGMLLRPVRALTSARTDAPVSDEAGVAASVEPWRAVSSGDAEWLRLRAVRTDYASLHTHCGRHGLFLPRARPPIWQRCQDASSGSNSRSTVRARARKDRTWHCRSLCARDPGQRMEVETMLARIHAHDDASARASSMQQWRPSRYGLASACTMYVFGCLY